MLLIRKFFEEEGKTRLEAIEEILNKVCDEFNPSFNGENFEVSDIARQNGFKTDLDYYLDLYKKWLDIKTNMPSMNSMESLISHMLHEITRGCKSSSFSYIVTIDDIIVACDIKW